MISINPDDIMKNYAIFQNILAKTKKDGEVVISKEDVLDREAFVKQIVDLAMVLSEKHKNCCFAIEGEWGSGKSFVLIKRAGKVTLVGVSPEPVLELDIATLNAMEGTIYSVYRYRNLYPKAIKAVSGGLIPLKKIVSHVFDFKDCIHAIEYSNDHKDEVIKGVIKF